jgi:hypothetical protein
LPFFFQSSCPHQGRLGYAAAPVKQLTNLDFQTAPLCWIRFKTSPFAVYINIKDPKPSQDLHSSKALASVFADLNKYVATMHFTALR